MYDPHSERSPFQKSVRFILALGLEGFSPLTLIATGFILALGLEGDKLDKILAELKDED